MPATEAGSRSTLPMTVRNTGFLLDRLGEDCHPLQFLRELTKNSVEAILKTPTRTGEVLWDVDWATFDLTAVYKLSVTDNGCGMTGPDMVGYINQLSSSGTEQSMSGNYGVGAKIAAATRNREGVIYLSWVDGEGSMIHLWRDSKTGAYGLKQFERPDGTFAHNVTLEDEVKPEIIKDNGTKIVLLGNSELQDTMQPPTVDTPSPSRWIAKYLNTRYFRFPKGVSVRVREGWENPRSDKDRNVVRTLVGQEMYLTDHSECSGKVKLADAVAHWWILREEPALTNNSGFVDSSGHVAALYQDELYEAATGRSGTARLQAFGIIFGYRQVVIYVEPKPSAERRVTTNTARTMLLLNNEPLPWADWAVQFRENMPDQVRRLVEQKAEAASETDHSKSIRERLRQIIDLYKISRYRPTPAGELRIDDQVTARAGAAKREPAAAQTGTGQSGGGDAPATNIYSLFQKENGQRGERVQPDVFPEVRWISIKDGTRDGTVLEDRAARFHIQQNLLLINADFRVFTDMVSKFMKDFGNNAAFYEVIRDSVHLWFEQALVETVIGIHALRNSKEWAVTDIETALSEEALTAVVIPRYHVNNQVKRELGSKLGKVHDLVVAQ
ncbi:MAG TPA: hypothetical protein VIN93_05270 [Bryobacteraceae bacterium]